MINAINITLLTLNIAVVAVVAWLLAAAIAARFVKTVRWFLSC